MNNKTEWCFGFNEEEFRGRCESREEAIEEAMDMATDDEYIFVGKIKEIKNFHVNTSLLLDNVLDQALEQVGEFADGYLDDVTKKEESELESKMNQVLNEWINKYHKPHFYMVEDDYEAIPVDRKDVDNE